MKSLRSIGNVLLRNYFVTQQKSLQKVCILLCLLCLYMFFISNLIKLIFHFFFHLSLCMFSLCFLSIKIINIKHSQNIRTIYQTSQQFRAPPPPSSTSDSVDGQKIKCTLIPGDGVGPELVASVKEVFSAMGVPIEFEELFFR